MLSEFFRFIFFFARGKTITEYTHTSSYTASEKKKKFATRDFNGSRGNVIMWVTKCEASATNEEHETMFCKVQQSSA